MYSCSGRVLVSIIITLLFYHKAAAQFYYKDIWNPLQLTRDISALKEAKLRAVSVKSYDANSEAGEGFFCEQKINKNYSVSETVTRSNFTSQSLLSSYFDAKGRVIKTTDSTESSLNSSEYFYDDSNHLQSVLNLAKASDDPAVLRESHVYQYNSGGRLTGMVRTKNGVKMSEVNFKLDEKGNVIEEQEVPVNGSGKKYYYYYDDKNHLTDVVHYYERAKRLLPDYMYEYNSAGQIKQMTTIEDGGGYYIWRYIYNEFRLKASERCFSKEKKLVGSVQYTYR